MLLIQNALIRKCQGFGCKLVQQQALFEAHALGLTSLVIYKTAAVDSWIRLAKPPQSQTTVMADAGT